MALLDWERQKRALVEIARVLRPKGVLVLMEGTEEGLARLNDVRAMFGLPAGLGVGRTDHELPFQASARVFTIPAVDR